MALFSKRATAWDKIKAAVADAAASTADRAGQLGSAAADVASDGWESTKSAGATAGQGIRAGASASADAVGRGVSAVEHKAASIANGVVAGALAGAFAAWVMQKYQAVDAAHGSPLTEQAVGAQGEASQTGGSAKTAAAAVDGNGENATVAVAEKISREQFGHELTEAEKPVAGAAVHYLYGAAMGALYGGLTELVPAVGAGLGLPYATALWLFGDEIATAKLGLAKPPAETTPAEHAAGFASHLVYGATLDISRRVLRHIV